ncbi:MAG: homocitrate synthase/isopropylmalate synthase family protein [Candidatus Natronoplasma sp.]
MTFKSYRRREFFAQESGLYVDGILKDHPTYEPINPEKIDREQRFVIGKHSGRHAVKKKLKE